jgi:hypothetical protein
MPKKAMTITKLRETLKEAGYPEMIEIHEEEEAMLMLCRDKAGKPGEVEMKIAKGKPYTVAAQITKEEYLEIDRSIDIAFRCGDYYYKAATIDAYFWMQWFLT